MKLLAIDPGLRCSGWALFADGVLRECGAVLNPAPGTAAEMGRKLFKRLMGNAALPAVVERPQVYQGRLQKGDPNDLIDVAVVAGSVATWAEPCTFAKPHDWKGTIPKNRHLSRYIVHKRNEQALDVASCEAYRKGLSLYCAPLRHNIADAVGLGLWFLRTKAVDNDGSICHKLTPCEK